MSERKHLIFSMSTTFLVAGLTTLAVGCGGDSKPPVSETEPTSGELGAAGGEAEQETAAVPLSKEEQLQAAIASTERSEENKARDGARHPAETLTFFGVEPGMTVVELNPSGGWYSEILAGYLGREGKLVAAVPSSEGESAKYAQTFLDRMKRSPALFANTSTQTFAPPGEVTLGEPASADVVLTFRNVHSLLKRGQAKAFFQAAAAVLKPGGVLGVVQHRAKREVSTKVSGQTGYVAEKTVVALAKAAGLTLEEKSEINANPKDTGKHPEGVWTLPPTLRLGDKDREKYEAIGESDRMTLRFRK